MKLKQLIKDIPIPQVKGSKEIEITGISADSRTISPGSLFIAKKGGNHDGVQFIPQALQGGAAAIVTDIYDPFIKQTQLIHPRPEQIEALLAARYYGNPSSQLFVVGTTGTKGKTTTTYLVKHLLDGLQLSSGLISTVETVVGNNRFSSTLTTHDVIANQKLLKEMLLKGAKACALEVSSHGLDQGRVDEIRFRVGIFTNLYADHLDYHPTMEDYAKAKRKLFAKVTDCAIFNADSPWSSFMREGCSAKILTFGLEQVADVQAKELQCNEKGTRFQVSYQGKTVPFQTPLIGRYNVRNVLGVICLGIHLGASLEEIAHILSSFTTVPGRLEKVVNKRKIEVFVDFAHTGDALDNVLHTLKEIAPRRLLVLFGCGGNRDPQRRKGMALAAQKWADEIVVTSDNPRQEDPVLICQEIVSHFSNAKNVQVEIDRKKAIQKILALAEPQDIVLIAGKGHERMQIFAHQTIPFDDVLVAKEALQNLSHSAILSNL